MLSGQILEYSHRHGKKKKKESNILRQTDFRVVKPKSKKN